VAQVTRDGANRRLSWKLAVIACAMFGFGFAMIPFYRQFCEVTGINNLIKPDTELLNTQVDTNRWLTIEFDANLGDLPWQFAPLERSIRVHPGEVAQVRYEVRNLSGQPIAGQAIPSYGPELAGRYFKKLECFCFTKQVLAPGERRQMPVVFVVDPALPADVTTVTLSYKFFQVDGATAAADAPGAS
jgi:cytochrome c oxidase assembly protein subunit 11